MDLIGVICLLALVAVILPSGCASRPQKRPGLAGEFYEDCYLEKFRAPHDETFSDLAAVSVAAFCRVPASLPTGRPA